MARDFNLDPNAAREANTGGKRIQATGKYAGKIVAAFYEKNGNGTESFNLMFESSSSQEAGPLAIYTHNGDGKELSGYKLVNAIMTCCKIKALTARMAEVEFYDFDTRAIVKKQKEVYSELTGKPIGLVLQQEEYQKTRGDGGVGTRMIIAAPFEAETERMAGEILDKKLQPEQLGKFMEYIAANPVRKLRNKPAANSGNDAAYDFQAPSADDDIPWD